MQILHCGLDAMHCGCIIIILRPDEAACHWPACSGRRRGKRNTSRSVHQGSILYRRIITNGRGQLEYPDARAVARSRMSLSLAYHKLATMPRCCDAPLFAFTLCRPHSPVILCKESVDGAAQSGGEMQVFPMLMSPSSIIVQ